MNKFVMKSMVALFATVAFGSVMADNLTVSAAASLKEAFNDINQQFEKKHPEHKVSFNFAASGSLLQQISNGAPVDVFASADLTTMQQAKDKNLLLGDAKHFVKNALVAIVPKDSTLQISGLSDLESTKIKRIAVGNASSVPAGRYTMSALKKDNLDEKLKDKIILTQNVRQALEYVASSNVDVGFVYKTDSTVLADRVKVVFEVPLDNPVIYPIAVIKDSKAPGAAQQFVDYVLSADGQAVLAKYGFSRP
jgi:molybdate transport system substrate-binding protein